MTAVANAAFTAAQFNTHVRDNLNETAPAKATTAGGHFVATGANAIAERIPQTNAVATSETTASASYADLATVGPTVTATTGTKALVLVYCRMVHTTAGAVVYAGVDVSGATTLAAADDGALVTVAAAAGGPGFRASTAIMYDALTAGSNTFRLKYKTSAATATYVDRRIAVIPF
jgi:hypothetical protein